MHANTANRFSWNAGALAGSALGCCLWMPATAITSGWHAVGIAAAVACALLVLFSAWLIWRSRERMTAFTGFMVLLVVGFLATVLFFAAAAGWNLPIVNRWPGGKAAPALSYAWVLLLYPVIAAWLWLQARVR